jgi:hypothetical protein
VIDLRLRRGVTRTRELPDLAIAHRDISREGRQIRVAVHNVGGAPAELFRVVLQRAPELGGGGETWETVANRTVAGLPAIRELCPVVQEVGLELESWTPGDRLRVVVDPDGDVEEICKANNRIELR